MLRFTPEQQAFVLANRRQFNASQVALANAHGQTLIGNALPLPKDVWGQWDREGVELQRTTLAVFNDLAASVATPMPIGKLVHHFQTISDSGSVNISLDGRSKARTDQPVFEYHGTPLPITDSTFSYGWRQVEAARSEGFQLDSAGRMNAMRRVAEKLESLALDGDAGIVVGGATLYGLRTQPKRNTRSTGVTLNGATGAQWLAEFTATLKLLHADNFKVPATVYVQWDDWFYATSTEFTTGYPKTIAQRVLELGGIREIIPADSLAADEIIAIVKDRRVVQVLNGMPMTTRAQFRANPEDEYNFVTMAAASIETKFDADDNCGIAHST
ncbi:encapsulating for peroxidase [Blastomonas sp. AAP25]|uniref:major capsid protein n=1 Tax=Blastomonas sp. AAP25 TaxID=1523416 RepID=UPI0006B93DA6|nr:major capsid protein [Blastomonas sp. AAP25]KPF74558.1 encapsulating for peroxidase [Blastomonas sp. AAP25]